MLVVARADGPNTADLIRGLQNRVPVGGGVACRWAQLGRSHPQRAPVTVPPQPRQAHVQVRPGPPKVPRREFITRVVGRLEGQVVFKEWRRVQWNDAFVSENRVPLLSRWIIDLVSFWEPGICGSS